ncbi:hypothetical protein [Nocardia cyriacigeorgica]|uniref:Uncharacterized protein n=1 Tax=Nocardia cyriacigeorgica TaxID=135487 RepID=A0A5R8NJL1_9NOCA|nr:hypothetical protein [Nocardia cyriacigeorgica]TLF74787.1 hypothetical protein FEK34_22535 [Nocardia cyriacigeorgica]
MRDTAGAMTLPSPAPTTPPAPPAAAAMPTSFHSIDSRLPWAICTPIAPACDPPPASAPIAAPLVIIDSRG